MALKTLKVRDIRKLLDGLPDEQDVLLIDADGCAAEIREIDPLTVKDTATGEQVLTIEFTTDPDRWFGFASPPDGVKLDMPEIDSND
jgi:hypothetical protein